MSTTYRTKRSIERQLRCRTRFILPPWSDSEQVELHADELYHPDAPDKVGYVAAPPTTWLGTGATHDEALDDALETLRVRGLR